MQKEDFRRLPDAALEASFAVIDAVAVPFRLKIQPQPGALPGEAGDSFLIRRIPVVSEVRRQQSRRAEAVLKQLLRRKFSDPGLRCINRSAMQTL